MGSACIKALVKALAVVAVVLFGAASASSQSLVLAQAIDLPAVTGRIDHLNLDLEGNLLFVAALAAGSLEVIDLRTRKRMARLTSLSEPQGVAYLPARHRVVQSYIGGGASRSGRLGRDIDLAGPSQHVRPQDALIDVGEETNPCKQVATIRDP